MTKSSVVYEQGTVKTATRTTAVGISSTGKFLAGTAKSVSIGRSIESQKNAPPMRFYSCVPAVLATPIAWFLSMMLLAFIAPNLIVVLLVPTFIVAPAVFWFVWSKTPHEAFREADDAAQSAYDRQWSCNQCGEHFQFPASFLSEAALIKIQVASLKIQHRGRS